MNIRGGLFLASVSFAAAVSAQPFDFAIEIAEAGVPVPGGDVVYGLVVSADWWTDAQEPFVVRLSLPPGFVPVSTCSGDFQFDAASQSVRWADRLDNPVIAQNSCPLLVRIDPSVVPGTAFAVTATLTTSAADRNPANNSATATGTVLPSSDLEVSSSVDVRTYRPGATVTFTYVLTNHGPQDARDAVLDGDVSLHHEIVSFEQTSGPAAFLSGPDAIIPILPSGGSASFRLTARAKSDFEAAHIRNRVSVQSASADLNPRNNESDLWTFAGPDADLSVTAAREGSAEREMVTIRVSNDGPDAVNHVVTNHSLLGLDRYRDLTERVKFRRLGPSQGTCTQPVLTHLIMTPPPPPYWSVDCELGAILPGDAATITVVIERRVGGEAFRLLSSAGPTQNDPRSANNVAESVFDAVARRRAVRK